MPLALVTVRPGVFGEADLKSICRGILPVAIVEALSISSIEGAQLTYLDIEVKVLESGMFDVSNKDIEVIVFANDFQERRAILQRAVGHIAQRLQEFISGTLGHHGVTGFVWIRLAPAEFKEW